MAGQVIVALWQLALPPQSTAQAKPAGHVMVVDWHEPLALQSNVQTSFGHPPVHSLGQLPPGGVGSMPQSPPPPPVPLLVLPPVPPPPAVPLDVLLPPPPVLPPVPLLVPPPPPVPLLVLLPPSPPVPLELELVLLPPVPDTSWNWSKSWVQALPTRMAPTVTKNAVRIRNVLRW